MCLHTVTQPEQHQTNPVTGFYSTEKLNDHTYIFHSGFPADVLSSQPCTLFPLPAVSSFWKRFNHMPRTITVFVPSVHLVFFCGGLHDQFRTPQADTYKAVKTYNPSLFSIHCPSLFIGNISSYCLHHRPSHQLACHGSSGQNVLSFLSFPCVMIWFIFLSSWIFPILTQLLPPFYFHSNLSMFLFYLFGSDSPIN